jgi:DNA-binding LytR/AlgR family response regulator
MEIKCICVDDEPFALKQLMDYASKTPFLNPVAACSNAFEALQAVSDYSPDLIFVDINMPEMSGVELVKSLPSNIHVIFTTAYSEFAVESYRLNAVDYLLKPFPYQDFLQAANKVLQKFDKSEKTVEGEKNDYIFVKADGKIHKVEFSKIDYLESAGEYVKFYIAGEKPLMSLVTMKSVEAILPRDSFMRIHRSFIVNLEKITTIERNRIVFYGKTYIPISDQYKDVFKEFVEKRFL